MKMFPQMATHTDKLRLQFMEGDIFPELTPEEMEEWRAAVAEADAERTYFISEPCHCAVGTKPG